MDPNYLISKYGLLGVAIGLFIDMIGVPFPAQMTLALAGMAWANGTFEPIPLFITATVAHLAGSTIAYLIGRLFGQRIVLKYGRYIGLTEEKYHRAERTFEKYQKSIIFFGKFFPFISVWLLYISGINKINFWRFSLINGAATLCWVLIYTLLGRYLGMTIIHFETEMVRLLKYYGLPVLIVGIIFYILYRKYGNKWVA